MTEEKPNPVAILVGHNIGESTGVQYPIYFEEDVAGALDELRGLWDEVHEYRPETSQ